jgi:hypothetical protein
MVDKVRAFDQAFSAFKQALKDNFEVTAILDEDLLMAAFAEHLPGMIPGAVESDSATGKFVDQVYGQGLVEFNVEVDPLDDFNYVGSRHHY